MSNSSTLQAKLPSARNSSPNKNQNPNLNLNSKQHLSDHIYQAMLLLHKATQGIPFQQAILGLNLNSRQQNISDYAKALTYLATKNYGVFNELLDCFAQQKLAAHTRQLLIISLILLIKKQDVHQPFTVVNQSAAAAKKHPKTSYAAGLINAILRNFLRQWAFKKEGADVDNQAFEEFWQTHQNLLNHEDHDILSQALSATQILKQLPATWQEELTKYPEKIEQLKHTQSHPPLMLRVNAQQYSRSAYLAQLHEAGIAAEHYDFSWQNFSPTPTNSFAIQLLANHGSSDFANIKSLPNFATGAFSVQDAAAQILPQLLDLQNGLTILDACSAPGGKILSCLEQYKLHVDCVEIDAIRAEKITENLQRLNLQTQALSFKLHIISMEEFAKHQTHEHFDRIILDVPCSTSGVLRKHPEMIFARETTSPQDLSKLQFQMLSDAWRMLKPDGLLVYMTCSIFRCEGLDLIERFITQQNHEQNIEQQKCELIPSPLHIDITETHDGFFCAVLRKIK